MLGVFLCLAVSAWHKTHGKLPSPCELNISMIMIANKFSKVQIILYSFVNDKLMPMFTFILCPSV